MKCKNFFGHFLFFSVRDNFEDKSFCWVKNISQENCSNLELLVEVDWSYIQEELFYFSSKESQNFSPKFFPSVTKTRFSICDNRYIFLLKPKSQLFYSILVQLLQLSKEKLKIENSSMKANLNRCLYDSQLGLYLDPYCLYWLYIASKSNNTWITCNFCFMLYWDCFSFRDKLLIVLL